MPTLGAVSLLNFSQVCLSLHTVLCMFSMLLQGHYEVLSISEIEFGPLALIETSWDPMEFLVPMGPLFQENTLLVLMCHWVLGLQMND